MIILGIPFGTDEFIKNFWEQKLDDFKKEVNFFKSFHYHTLQAKAVISKSKLMPKIGYFGSVLPVPLNIQEKINDSILGYLIPHKRTFLKVENLAAQKSYDGIGLDFDHFLCYKLHPVIMAAVLIINYVLHIKHCRRVTPFLQQLLFSLMSG